MHFIDRALILSWRWVWWPLIQVWLVTSTAMAAVVFDRRLPPRILVWLVVLALPGCWVVYRWVRLGYRKWERRQHA